MPCLAPLVLIGYLFTLQVHATQTSNMNAPVLDLQSCETGWGVHAKASTSGLYAVGGQYGWTWQPVASWSVTLQPRAGVSYVDHPVEALPLRTQFELGTQLLLGYDRWRVGVEYWHLSNAGLRQPNTGLDLLEVLTGIVF